MFLKLNRRDFSWSRSKKALPVFFLLWIGGILLGLLYLFSVRAHLQAIERDQTEKLLDTFLAANQSANRLPGPFLLAAGHPVAGLGFYPHHTGQRPDGCGW